MSASPTPEPGQALAPARLPLDAVVGHHLNPYASGVARFNQVLAEHLGVPMIGLDDPLLRDSRSPLFSFKVSELPDTLAATLAERLDAAAGEHPVSCFLHEFCGLGLEQRLAEQSAVVFAGNDEILHGLEGTGANVVRAWAPGLIADHRTFKPAALTVFSFGMAHKLRADMFARLRDLLEETEQSYALYISNANHATATLREAQSVHEQMRAVFSHDLYFMGNLSDVAIHNHLQQATFFAAFFARGVRANNTSVLSAMEHGAVVITNLDEHSPPEFKHMENVIDIGRCERLPADRLDLRRISVRAMETARALSWDGLVAHVREHSG